MNTTVVAVKSITYALKARKLLRQGGFGANIVKLDSSKTEEGCTHGIEIHSQNLYNVVAILRENGIEYNVLKQ